MKISVITVTYNSGEKLKATIASVIAQSFHDFEIIIKDGLSGDNSLELIPEDSRVSICRCKDAGIYDAMNQAIRYVSGEYILFLNSGDVLHNPDVFKRVEEFIESDFEKRELYYGDVFVSTRNGVISAPEHLDNFTLITRTICHQCLFFSKKIFEKRFYNYREFGLASDMGLYVACIKKDGIKAKHMPFIISDYEGGGASETVETKKQIIKAKKKIMKTYFTKAECRKIVIRKIIQLKYLKEWLSCSRVFSRLYEGIASVLSKKIIDNCIK